MRIYVFAVYLPFIFLIIFFLREYIGNFSMSYIGWITVGLHVLVLYVLLTIPFCFYQIFFFNKHFLKNNTVLFYMSVGCCASVILGTFLPLVPNPYRYFNFGNFMHIFFSMGGVIVLIAAVNYALLLLAKNNTRKKRIFLFCGGYTAVLLLGLYIFWTAAVFQLFVSASLLLVLHSVIEGQSQGRNLHKFV